VREQVLAWGGCGGWEVARVRWEVARVRGGEPTTAHVSVPVIHSCG